MSNTTPMKVDGTDQESQIDQQNTKESTHYLYLIFKLVIGIEIVSESV